MMGAKPGGQRASEGELDEADEEADRMVVAADAESQFQAEPNQ